MAHLHTLVFLDLGVRRAKREHRGRACELAGGLGRAAGWWAGPGSRRTAWQAMVTARLSHNSTTSPPGWPRWCLPWAPAHPQLPAPQVSV